MCTALASWHAPGLLRFSAGARSPFGSLGPERNAGLITMAIPTLLTQTLRLGSKYTLAHTEGRRSRRGFNDEATIGSNGSFTFEIPTNSRW